MDTFMRLAKSNTMKNLETCGILAGSLVSHFIFPISLSISQTRKMQYWPFPWKFISNNDMWITTCVQKNRKFYITALIIPKQESTSDSVSLVLFWYLNLFISSVLPILSTSFSLYLQCQATNEEEIFEVQDKQSLFPLGWIHVSKIYHMLLYF